MIIYKVTNKINGKVYIGQTKHSLEHRKNGHERDTLSRKKHTTYFHEALAKYGFENFTWEVLGGADTQEKIDEMEKFYIAEYRATEKEYGYNLKLGGKEGGLYNDECRQRLGESTKRKWANPETAAKMLAGLRKGTETVKKNAEDYWEERVCKYCGKTFKVKPHQKLKYCSKECSVRGEVENKKACLEKANKLNKETFEKKRYEQCKLLFKWVKNNITTITSAKFNHLTFIKDIAEYIGVKDDRTCAKVTGCLHRKDFIKFLQKSISIIGLKGSPECPECHHITIENGDYIICPTCGYSKLKIDE